jgi:hypothetical protein
MVQMQMKCLAMKVTETTVMRATTAGLETLTMRMIWMTKVPIAVQKMRVVKERLTEDFGRFEHKLGWMQLREQKETDVLVG